MGERVSYTTDFLYSEDLRDQILAVFEKYGHEPELRDKQIAGWCKPGSTPTLELWDFQSKERDGVWFIDALATATKAYRGYWWLSVMGDAGDYASLWRFEKGEVWKIEAYGRGRELVQDNFEAETAPSSPPGPVAPDPPLPPS